MSTASVQNTFQNAVTATGLQLDNNFATIVSYINEPLNRNNFAPDTGTTNTIVLTFSPPVSAYSAGLEITFKAATTNTGATVINCNSLGNQNFVQPGGGALSSGQIQSSGIYLAAHNGSAFVFIGQNVLAASKADMQTATSAVTFVSPAQTQNHPGVAKAWVSFDGTATGTTTITSNGYNVSTVVRNSTGNYTLSFVTPFANSVYGAVVSANQSGIANGVAGGVVPASRSTATCTIVVAAGSTNAVIDSNLVVAAFYGAQ